MRTAATLVVSFCIGVLIGCNQKAAPPQSAEAIKTLSVTRWSEKTELFMEYPPLVAGQKARLAIHLTDLRTFKPIGIGRVTVRMVPSGETAQIFEADAPSRPGIFGVD